MSKPTRQVDAHLNKKNEMHLGRWQRRSGAERKRGAPEWNLKSMRYGIYANRFLREDPP